MGLKPKRELFHKWFVGAQAVMIAAIGAAYWQKGYFKETGANGTAREEMPKYPLFDLISLKIYNGIDKISKSIFK
jgi:hypothetical protein